MDIDEQTRIVQNKLIKLVNTHNSTRKENIRLEGEITTLRNIVKGQEAELEKFKEAILILKASAGSMGEKEKKEFEKHINQYIRDIEHCIGILSE